MFWLNLKEFYGYPELRIINPSNELSEKIEEFENSGFSWISRDKLHWVVSRDVIIYPLLKEIYKGDSNDNLYHILEERFGDDNNFHFVFSHDYVQVYKYSLAGSLVDDSDYHLIEVAENVSSMKDKSHGYAGFYVYLEYSTSDEAMSAEEQLKLPIREYDSYTYLYFPAVLLYKEDGNFETYFFANLEPNLLSCFPTENGFIVSSASYFKGFSVFLSPKVPNKEIKIEVKSFSSDWQSRLTGEYFFFRNGENIRNLLRIEKQDITEEFNSLFSWDMFFRKLESVNYSRRAISWERLGIGIEDVSETDLITFEKVIIDNIAD